jgi:two-component system sensor histidine kinase DesK
MKAGTMNTGCAPEAPSTGLPRWVRGPHAGTWAMLIWLPFLLAEPAAHANEAGAAWAVWLGLAVIATTFLTLGILGSRRLQGRPDSRLLELTLLAVQAGTTVALVLSSPQSSSLFPLLVIAAVVSLDGAPGLPAVPIVTGLAALAVGLGGGTSTQVTGAAVTTVLSGFGCWSFRRLFLVIAELARTRQTLAELAVGQERERFSRDLHDLLGHTLSVIVVKAQAARRLAPVDSAAAAEHAADIETIGRRALLEVRQAVNGYRGPGLTAELQRAQSALAAAGIAYLSESSSEAGPLPPEVDAAFGWVVREGVTNVIRHSGASSCVVVWSQDDREARLEITDDGRRSLARPDLVPELPPGGGLAGLSDRVRAGGGRLEAGPSADGFGLTVVMPVSANR